MADENKLINQKLDNLASKVEELNGTVTLTLKQFVLVTEFLQKKTVSWRKVSESLHSAYPSSRQQSQTQNPSSLSPNERDKRPF